MMKNIKELVEEAGVKLVPIGEGIYRGSCPFHTNLNTPSFTVYSLTNSWFCFGESIGGDHISFVSRLEGISYRAAKEKLEGNIDKLTEMVEMLDGLSVKDEIDYSAQTNFALSKYTRDLMYRRPELTNNVMNFLKKLDHTLQTEQISVKLMQTLIKSSRELDK